MMKRIMTCMFVLILSLALTAYAGDGVPDAYLSMESSSIEDGAVEVPLDGEIFMKFSNNVVNLKVNENNLTCFRLTDSEGSEVAIDVLMGDDQVDRTIKNDITVKPQEMLKENESYTLTISQALMSKNGNSMEEDVVITFDTIRTEAASNENRSMIFIAIGAVAAAVFLQIRNRLTAKKTQE